MSTKIRIFVLQGVIALALFSALLGLISIKVSAQPMPPLSTAPNRLALDPEKAKVVNENAVIYWDNVALIAIRLVSPGPPVVARALAMVHTAQYEAWSQYDATAAGSLLGSRYRQPVTKRTIEHQSEAMSYAAYRVLRDLFPKLSSLFDISLQEQGYTLTVDTTNPETAAGLGNLAAAVVLTYRHDDGANQLGDRHPGAYSDYTGYQPVNTVTQVNDLNYWQPLATPNGSFQGGCNAGNELIVQTYVGPHWGNVLPFALNDGAPITPTTGPMRYPSPEFTLQAQEILSISANLTDHEKIMAEYWADGPSSELPPGHWALIAQIVSQRDQHTLADDAKLFFALSNANLDAGILAWKLKRIYNSVRPITAIRELFRGQQVLAWAGPYSGTQMIDGGNWQPYQATCFVTPAFPEFVSGHSAYSAASAEVMKAFTGSDVFSHSVVITHSFVEPGLVPAAPVELRWQTFSAAADEAGFSRRYGGIHFAQGDLVGRALGRQVGDRVWTKAQRFFDGNEPPVADMSAHLTQIIALNHFSLLFNAAHFYLPIAANGPTLP